jgi:uncharacterized membrane protein
VIRAGWNGVDFLVLNLILATIPVLASSAFAESHRRRYPPAVQVISFVIWLLFLPNAPYIVTDFIHLQPRHGVPIWYDIALLTSAAGTGLLLGYSSLADVQSVVSARFGRRAGWSTAFAALALSAAGIYLGRFLRWNSWDALTNPRRLVHDVAQRGINPLEHPRSVVVTIVYGVSLSLGYIALHVVGAQRREAEQRAGRRGDRRAGGDRRARER